MRSTFEGGGLGDTQGKLWERENSIEEKELEQGISSVLDFSRQCAVRLLGLFCLFVAKCMMLLNNSAATFWMTVWFLLYGTVVRN